MAGGVLPSLSLDRDPSGPIAHVRLELLSGFALQVGGQSLSLALGPQRVIALLALQGHPLLREHIAGILWPDTPTGHAAASLRSALWRIQRLGGRDLVWTSRSHVGLAPFSVVDFVEVVGQARRLLGSNDRVRPEDLDYRPLTRDLLPDWYEEWVVAERERFGQLRLHALEALCRRLTGLGMFATAIQAGLAAVGGEPLRETAQRALIEAYIAEGNVAEAIRQYSTHRRMLFDDLGVDPSPTMVRLMGRLRGA